MTQNSVALSSGKAEYFAQPIQAQSGWTDMGGDPSGAVLSESAARRGFAHLVRGGRVRHLETRYIWLQSKARDGTFALKGVAGEHNLADTAAKHLLR